MFILGHTGITLGAALVLDRVVSGARGGGSAPEPVWGRTSLLSRVDIRLLLLGSMLPDIIDKPVGMVIFDDFFQNGRIFSHTVLFLLLLLGTGLFYYRRRGSLGLLVVAVGAVAHVVLDAMWADPETLLWPLYGAVFRKEPDFTFDQWVFDLAHTPSVYVPEIIGGLVLAWVAVRAMVWGRAGEVLRTGRL